MKRKLIPGLIFILSAGFAVSLSAALSIASSTATSSQPASPRAADDLRGFLNNEVTARAAGRGNPWITLNDGHSTTSEFSESSSSIDQLKENQVRPLSLGSGDFDEDGMPDLVAGYGRTNGGLVTIQRGDVDAVYPNTPEAVAHRSQQRQTFGRLPDSMQSPFLLNTRVFESSGVPQYIEVGDFDADGHADVVTAEAGGSSLSFLSGDGHGGFAPARTVTIPGKLTAIASGDINRIDGLADLIVAVKSGAGPRLLVYEGSNGALNAIPEVLSLPAESNSIAFGQLDEKSPVDIAVGAGRELVIVHGRDRKHTTIEGRKSDTQSPEVTRVSLQFRIESLTIGDFIGDITREIAVLADDGQCHLFARATGTQLWRDINTIALAGKQQGSGSRTLQRIRVSSSPNDDLLLVDPSSRQFQMIVNESTMNQSQSASANQPESLRLHMAGVIDFDDPPVSVIGMRLNSDALNDMVVLTQNASAPTLIITAPQTTFSVMNTNDSGPGSLRQAITDANSMAGTDAISFNIAGAGTKTINLLSPLPVLSSSVTIDGTTQSPGTATPPIELNGTNAGASANAFTIGAGSTTIRGLTINSFATTGINIAGGSHIIEGDFIGTNAAGGAGTGNGDTAIVITAGSAHQIGGTTAAAKTVLAGNAGGGILVLGPAMDNKIQGCMIGTNAAGTAVVANQSDGILMLSGTNNVINCTIGGTVAGARNVISGNLGVGVQFLTVGTSNLVQGNLIGTDVTGSIDLGNGSSGVALNEANDCTVGGTVAGAGNVISGNDSNGVRINATTATGNRIQGNFIGTKADGVSSLPNSADGIRVLNSASNNTIGGAGGANKIAFNVGAGIVMETGTGNAIQQNSIFSNNGLGIDLLPAGVTPNDAGDGDSGPNTLQNFPVLTTANTAAGGGANVQGTLNSTASTTFTLEFFSNASCDASGNGEGRTFLGSGPATTNASGNASFNLTLPIAASVGEVITATATNPAGNTSEFSACVSYGAADLGITKLASAGTIVVGTAVTYTITVVNNGPDAATSVAVTDNLPAAVTFSSCSSTAGGVCGGSANNRTVSFSSIAAGASAVITINANVNCTDPNGQVVSNTATVSSPVRDPSNTNNSSSVNFTVSNPPRTIMPTSINYASDGGDGTVSVTAPANCGWQAIPNDPWLSVTSGALGNGNGTVGYHVAVNATGNPRSGTITIAGQTFTVNQSNLPCSYQINPTSASYAFNGGNGSVTVTALAGCMWKAIPSDSWITLTGGTGNGTGNGSFAYSVGANPSSIPRNGSISIGGNSFMIMQGGAPCSFAISPIGKLFGINGDESSFSLITPAGCQWMTTASDPWIFITSPLTLVGPDVVTFGVRDNFTGAPRTGTVTAGGQMFHIVQDGLPPGTCTFTLNPTQIVYGADGGPGSVQVSTGSSCGWQATSNVGWIKILSDIVGLGGTTVNYAVDPNSGPVGRAGIITIGGAKLRIKQTAN